MLRAIGLVAAFLIAVWCASPAQAQSSAAVVASCGTLPQQYAAGSTRPIVQDINGKICTNGASSITTWAGGTLGAMANFGSSPGAVLVPGANVDTPTSSNLYTAITAPLVAGSNYVGQFGLNAVAAGGWSYKWFVAAASDNATNLKNGPGIVHAVQIYGIDAAPAWLKFYDKASSSTCAIDTIVKQFLIPAASTAANGAGNNAVIIDTQFLTGISYCVVKGIAANDDTSVDSASYVVNIDWK